MSFNALRTTPVIGSVLAFSGQEYRPLTPGDDLIAEVAAQLGLAVGTDVQAWDQALQDISDLTPSADDLLVSDGSNWGTLAKATLEQVANKGAVDGYAGLDATGKVPLAQLPQSALERLSQVADQTARYALTTATVQNGDSVKQLDTGTMYVVVDDTELDNANGYEEYTAGTAAAVQWSGITAMPAAIDAIDGLTPAADKLPYYTGASAAALTDLSSYGRSLIDDADAAAAQTTLGLGGAAVLSVGLGLDTSGSDIILKNAASLTNNYMPKWDDGNGQLADSIISVSSTQATVSGSILSDLAGDNSLKIDGYSSGNNASSISLRNRNSPTNDYTYILRSYSTHSSLPDTMLMRHYVAGSLKAQLSIDNAGKIGIAGKGSANTVEIEDAKVTLTTGVDILPTDSTGQDLGDATRRWDLFAGEISCNGATSIGALSSDVDGSNLMTIDGYNSGNDAASIYFRNRLSTGTNRTLFTRTFSSHSSQADSMLIRHYVAGSLLASLDMSGAGKISIAAGGSANVMDIDSAGVTLADAKNIKTNTTTGSIIADATSQKLGFWGATPVIQPASANQAALGAVTTTGANTGTAGAGLSLIGDTSSADQSGPIMNDFRAVQEDLAALFTLVNQLRSDNVSVGLIKGSA